MRAVPKLTYFNLEAAAEKVRLAFAMTETDFEDNRVDFKQWPDIKPTTPWGQLPILEVDGKVWTQSYGMLRWAGQLGDGSLYPADKLLEIEEVIGIHEDLGKAFTPALYIGMRPANLGHEFATDEEKAGKVKALREKFAAEDLPKFMGFYSQILTNNGPFFCGSKVTIADLAILPQLRYFTKGVVDHIPSTCLDGYPVLKAWIDRMMEIPPIKAWYAAH